MNLESHDLSTGMVMPSSMTNDSSSIDRNNTNSAGVGIENWRDKFGGNQSNKQDFTMWSSAEPPNRLANSTSFKLGDPGNVASRSYSEQQLDVKVDMVYGLCSILDNQNKDEVTKTLLTMSHSSESCMAMRQSGCISLLVQHIHSEDEDCTPEIRQRAAQALHNIVHCHNDDKQGRREVRLLRLLEKIRTYCETMSESTEHSEQEEIGQVIAALMKLSFDEDHRYAMCQLGALYTLAKLIQLDTEYHGSNSNKFCIVLRKYAGMTVTNLTFGHGSNKSTLCCLPKFMKALVMQLSTPSEHLRQVTASVLRNLSWRADPKSKQSLREVGAVPALMKAAMEATKESTLKSILSALWNFSAHCNNNKIDICSVEGALPYLVDKMRSSSQTSMTIVENAGGVMKNISSHIAVKENYRVILREHQCLQLLLDQLRSPSLTVVSNACGTLWNLSALCIEDQMTLWSLGAVPMLKSLIHSRHKMISTGASAALKNLLAAKPDCDFLDKGSKGMPSLLVRKRRALEKELDANLAETCDNIENSDQPSPITPQCAPQGLFTSTLSMTSSTSSQHHVQSTSPASLHSSTDSSALHSSSSGHHEDRRITSENELEDHDDVHNVSREEYDDCQDDLNASQQQSSSPTPYLNKTVTPNTSKNSTYADNDEKERDHTISFSKIEESYHHNMEDEVDSHSQYINLDEPTDYSVRYTEKQKSLAHAHSNNNNSNNNNLVDEDDVPKTFCTEDTPCNFSTATSLSDLRIINSGDISACKTPEDSKPPSGRTSPQKHGGSSGIAFNETPLVFSRCSSLGSLSSCDQHEQIEQPDDRSSVAPEDRFSVVSEFSRMTSGMISPSELPDSPLQTAPVSPSPRGNSTNLKFTYPSPQPPRPGTQHSSKPIRSVFEDTVATYKDEDLNDSKSSLSDQRLIGVDDPDAPGHKLPPPPTSAKDELKCYAVEESPCNMTAWSSLSDLTINTNTSVSATNAKHNESDEDDDGKKIKEDDQDINDEDILQQCIAVGMESAKVLTLKKEKKTPAKRNNSVADEKSQSDGENNEDEDILAKCIQMGIDNVKQQSVKKSTSNLSEISSKSKETPQPVQSSTPRHEPNLSLHTAAPGTGIKLDLSDEEILQQCIIEGMSGYCQATDEAVLQQCIKAGMEKFKLEIQNKNRNNTETSIKNVNPNQSSSAINNVTNKIGSLNISEKPNSNVKQNTGPEKYFDLDQWANDVNEQDSTLLLEQCIEAGIPYKSKNVLDPSVINQQQAQKESITHTTITMTGGNQNENKAQSEVPNKKPEVVVKIQNRDVSLIKNEMVNSMKNSMNSSMGMSMNNSFRVENMNDDLCEGIMVSSKIEQEMISSKLENDLMKESMTNTWSEADMSCPSVSLSPPSCLKPTFTFENDNQNKKSTSRDVESIKKVTQNNQVTMERKANNRLTDINESVKRIERKLCHDNSVSLSSDSANSSPVRKTIAKVNPFPETAKIVTDCDKEMSKNVLNEILNLNSDAAKHAPLSSLDPIILSAADEMKYSSIIDLECGKLGLISSLEFEDISTIKPPCMLESISCMDKSLFNKNNLITSMNSSVNLDSVKPPSNFEEINHILADEDLMEASICNIDSIVSEVASDDEDITLQVDDVMPYDHDTNETVACKLERKITPKQKRNISKERYNTFTLEKTVASDSNKPEKLTPKQKRQLNRDRYATRTIADDDVSVDNNHDTFVVAASDDADSSTLMSGNVSEIEDFEMDDEEVYGIPAQPPKSLPSSTAAQPSEAHSSKLVSKLQKPTTLKLKSGIPVSSIADSKNSSSSSTCSAALKTTISPMSPPQPLQRQGTFTKDEPTTPISNIPVLTSFSCQTTPKKSASITNTQKPASTSSIKYRNNSQPNIKRNVQGGSSVRNSFSNYSLKQETSHSSSSINRRSFIDLSSSYKNSPSTNLNYRKSYSNSNSSLNSIKSTISYSSNKSNASSRSGSSTPGSVKTTHVQTPQPKKQITSKIANLWKRVEDSKKSDTSKKDNRVWITGDTNSK